ncbi:hypothetical protein HDA32_002637 [Spinactinospora alkalitolerans]|uniref:Uncharacterized protein n=1 Tax=Spinactinospora alkalitolerans TaxID=687207 RepID=A0A852TW29_9ACTN|nr:hypothetical protein [Spinactinospora alkalitolerans]NYE47517.1 hypothetical protein [Spinactinospora alkalitolerans]
MRLRKFLGSSAAAVVLSAGAFGALGAAAPSAHAGLLCNPTLSGTTVGTVCKGFSGNDFTQVRAVAGCITGKVYGPWVNGSTSTSKASCTFAPITAAVQYR